jgi:hypothetical protein
MPDRSPTRHGHRAQRRHDLAGQQAGGVIAGGTGGTAISAGAVLTLTNAGTINGNVTAGLGATPYTGSVIDSTAGTINGNSLGAGNDTLVATWQGSALHRHHRHHRRRRGTNTLLVKLPPMPRCPPA